VEAVSRQHLGHSRRKLLPHKALVVTDDHIFPGMTFCLEPAGKSLSTTAYIGKGVIIGDAPAPAIGAKFNISHGILGSSLTSVIDHRNEFFVELQLGTGTCPTQYSPNC
jgi:hypothetical protein